MPFFGSRHGPGPLALGVLALTLLFGCAKIDYGPRFEAGHRTGDLRREMRDCSCTYYPRDREAQVVCGAGGNLFILWVPLGPRDHERYVGGASIWLNLDGEYCDNYGYATVDSWIGDPIDDPRGSTSTTYRPLFMQVRTPAQSFCQGDGVLCFDYDNCYEWEESVAEDVEIYCAESVIR